MFGARVSCIEGKMGGGCDQSEGVFATTSTWVSCAWWGGKQCYLSTAETLYLSAVSGKSLIDFVVITTIHKIRISSELLNIIVVM